MNDLPSTIPSDYQAITTVIIGLISSMLVQPLTAIAKKYRKTEGVDTVKISFWLSLAIGFAFALSSALSGTGSLWGAIPIALTAFIRSNGDYILRKSTAAPASADSTDQPAPASISPLAALPDFSGLSTVLGILGSLGVQATPANLLKVGMQLAGVVPDFLDDAELSVQSRATVLSVIMDLKEKGKL